MNDHDIDWRDIQVRPGVHAGTGAGQGGLPGETEVPDRGAGGGRAS